MESTEEKLSLSSQEGCIKGIFQDFFGSRSIFKLDSIFYAKKQCFLSSSMQNHAERSRNYFKKSVWDPKRAKWDQNSDFGHVRTYSWLHRLRNTQGKTYGTYLGNIYGIYQEHIRNIHKYLWYEIIRNTEHSPNGSTAKRPPHWGAAEGGACVSHYFIS